MMGKPHERKKGLEHKRREKTWVRKYERMGKVGKGFKRWLLIFSEGEERIRVEMVAVKKKAKIRIKVRRNGNL